MVANDQVCAGIASLMGSLNLISFGFYRFFFTPVKGDFPKIGIGFCLNYVLPVKWSKTGSRSRLM